MKKNNLEKIKKEFEDLFLDGKFSGRIITRVLNKGYTKPSKCKDIWNFLESAIKRSVGEENVRRLNASKVGGVLPKNKATKVSNGDNVINKTYQPTQSADQPAKSADQSAGKVNIVEAGNGYIIKVKDGWSANKLAVTRKELEKIALYGQIMLKNKKLPTLEKKV